MLDVSLINYSIRRWWGSKLLWILVIFSLLWKPILVRGERKSWTALRPLIYSIYKKKSLRKSQLLWVPKWYPMHFFPSDRNKSKPSHEFAGDRKNLLTWSAFRTSGQTNRMTYFPRFAFNLSQVIFFAYSYFLLVYPLSVLCSVCLFNISLLLFSNEMKSSFLFYRGTRQFNHAHG